MSSFKLLKSETKKLTRELAEEFRSLPASPTEREYNEARVKHLRAKAEAGQLVTFQWATALLNSTKLRMNGQHSSQMLCGLDGAFPDNLTVHLDEYEVDGEMSLALLFRQFDDRVSGRSAGDVSGAYQMLKEPLREIPRKAAKYAIEGITWQRHFVEGVPTKSGDDRYELFNETGTHAFVTWMGEILSDQTHELKKAPIIGAMYASFNASEDDAKKFWRDVGLGGLPHDDTAPATVLFDWIKEMKDNKIQIKPGQYYQGSIFAWNAFRDNKPITKAIKCDTSRGFHSAN